MKNEGFKQFFIMILCVIIGWGCAEIWHTTHPVVNTGDVIIPDSIIKEDNNKIDSLQTVIENLKEKKESIRDSIVYLTKIKTVEISKVKALPLDSGIIFLRKKLREYEN